jgi:hypothetical protein
MDTAALLLELGGVLLGLGISAQLARRLGLSPIPLYLLTGLAFGQDGLLPLVTTQDFIQVGAEIGVILLLLLLGLEYSAAELLSSLRASAPAGLVDLVLTSRPGWPPGCCWAGDRWRPSRWAASPTSRPRGSPPSSSATCIGSPTARLRSCCRSSSSRTWPWPPTCRW